MQHPVHIQETAFGSTENRDFYHRKNSFNQLSKHYSLIKKVEFLRVCVSVGATINDSVSITFHSAEGKYERRSL